MNPTLMRGTIIVTCALICYSIAVITEQRKRGLAGPVLIFLSLGVLLDIIATCCMIAGSRGIRISVHGVLGYSALGAMLADCVLLWRARITARGRVSPKLHCYTRIAYAWWVSAYVAGAVMAMTMFHR